MNRKSSFLPVVDKDIRILILGSLPGELSLAQNQYYANPQNRFWNLVSEIIGIDLQPLEYATRLKVLLENQIGMWDVIATANRSGSLDGNIRDHANNDLVGLVNELPHLKTIAFNGKTAARIGLKALKDQASKYRIIHLPSSSPAYTLAYSQKLSIWMDLKKIAN